MTDEVTACPDCEDRRIYHRAGKMGQPVEQGREYLCMACGHEFAEPIRRKDESTGGPSPDENTGSSPLAAALLKADPDEVGP